MTCSRKECRWNENVEMDEWQCIKHAYQGIHNELDRASIEDRMTVKLLRWFGQEDMEMWIKWFISLCFGCIICEYFFIWKLLVSHKVKILIWLIIRKILQCHGCLGKERGADQWHLCLFWGRGRNSYFFCSVYGLHQFELIKV